MQNRWGERVPASPNQRPEGGAQYDARIQHNTVETVKDRHMSNHPALLLRFLRLLAADVFLPFEFRLL